MDEEHKKKILASVDVVEKAYKGLHEYAIKHAGDKEGSKFHYFLLENTIVAGGLFRSVFTDQPVSDVYMYFLSPEAVEEFKHIVAKSPLLNMFPSSNIAKRYWYNLPRKNAPNIVIDTKTSGKPSDILATFDFTFNQHYLRMFDFTMRFDRDTFNKAGGFVRVNEDPIKVYMRYLRFLEQGWKFNHSTPFSIASAVYNSERRREDHRSFYSHEYPDLTNTGTKLSGRFYTEADLQQKKGVQASDGVSLNSMSHPTETQYWTTGDGIYWDAAGVQTLSGGSRSTDTATQAQMGQWQTHAVVSGYANTIEGEVARRSIVGTPETQRQLQRSMENTATLEAINAMADRAALLQTPVLSSRQETFLATVRNPYTSNEQIQRTIINMEEGELETALEHLDSQGDTRIENFNNWLDEEEDPDTNFYANGEDTPEPF